VKGDGLLKKKKKKKGPGGRCDGVDVVLKNRRKKKGTLRRLNWTFIFSYTFI
jgi:hypothetical protein